MSENYEEVQTESYNGSGLATLTISFSPINSVINPHEAHRGWGGPDASPAGRLPLRALSVGWPARRQRWVPPERVGWAP